MGMRGSRDGFWWRSEGTAAAPVRPMAALAVKTRRSGRRREEAFESIRARTRWTGWNAILGRGIWCPPRCGRLCGREVRECSGRHRWIPNAGTPVAARCASGAHLHLDYSYSYSYSYSYLCDVRRLHSVEASPGRAVFCPPPLGVPHLHLHELVLAENFRSLQQITENAIGRMPK